MEIILIRHPQAEKRRFDLEDDRRYLTKKGQNKLQRLMPELEEKLLPIEERKLVIWSSPALRALEVAHFIALNFRINMLSIHDFIYEGEFQEFNFALQNVDEEATLFVVGHQPYLSEWVYDMTGVEERFKKGNVFDLEVTNKEPLKAEMKWKIS